MVDRIELDVPARPEYLSLVRMVISAAAASDPAFEAERIDDVRLAVSEATTNAMEAQCRPGEVDRVAVTCCLDLDTVVVEVLDQGGGFEPDSLVEHPPVTDPARLEHESGLGIPLIRILTDEVDFRRSEGGMVVRMVFRPGTLPGRIGGVT